MTSIQLDAGNGGTGGGGGGATNLGYTAAAAQGTVTSSTGTAATLPLAGGGNAGLMTSAEKAAIAALGSTYQPLDADLTALAGLAGVQGDIIYRDATQWQRLPAGTSGQFLKTLGAGANPTWAAGGGGGSVATDAIWTAKGQLAAATGVGAAAALAPGSDSQVLVADSSQSAGVRWASVLWKHARPVSTWFGLPGCTVYAISGYVGFADRRVYAYFRVESPISLTDWTCYVTAGAGNARAFVGSINPSTGAVSAVVADFGSLSVATTGQKTATLGTPVTLPTGFYELCVSTDSTPTIYQYSYTGGVESIVDVSGSNNAVGQPRLLSAPTPDTTGPSFISSGAPATLGLLKWTVI